MDKLITKFNKIVIMIGRGEVQALDELYNAYGGLLYSMAKKYLADKSYAEDVVSEVFCKIVKYSPKFDQKQNGLNWAFKIVKNTCIDWNKKYGYSEDLSECESLTSVLPSQEDVAARADLKNALSFLSDEENAILYFKYWEGLTVRQIAEKLNKPKSDVQYVYKRAIKKLAQILDDKR